MLPQYMISLTFPQARFSIESGGVIYYIPDLHYIRADRFDLGESRAGIDTIQIYSNRLTTPLTLMQDLIQHLYQKIADRLQA